MTLTDTTGLEEIEDPIFVPGKLVICVTDSTGDTKHIWSPDNADEVAAARKLFEDMTAKGYNAYAVTKDGGEGERMRRFDPTAEAVILVAPLVGG